MSRAYSNRCQREAGQLGVGLVEILVAILILAVGFLAAARMQVSGMRYSQSAYFQSQAYFMAGDMVARMRANVAGVKAKAYDGLKTQAGLEDPGCSAKLCTPAEIAAQDIYDWSQHLHNAVVDQGFTPLLPSSDDVKAAGQVSLLSDGQYSVTVTWADEYDDENGKGTLRVDLITEN